MVKLNVFFHLILLMQLWNAIMPQGEIYFHDDRSRIYMNGPDFIMNG